MKKFILFFALALSITVLFSQGTAILRVEMPDPLPTTIGEQFFVGIWLDELTHPLPDNYFKSGQMYVEYNSAVTALSSGPPFNMWYFNLNSTLNTYNAAPAASNPPDQLAYVFYTTFAPGVDWTLMGTPLPQKLWDMKFEYNGGDIELQFGDEAKLVPVAPNVPGGKLEKGLTKLTVWNNDVLTLTLIGYPSGTSPYVWTGAVDDDWDEIGNWEVGGVPATAVPTEADEVEIPNVTKAPFPTIYGSAATGTLTIFGGQLNVAPMADLTTHGLFTNGGLFVVESNGMVNPGLGESGSYIDLGGIAPGGAFEFQRDVTNSTPFGAQDGWHFISSPLPGGEFTSDDLHYYYVNWFNSVTQQYVPIEGSATVPCQPAATVANNLMEGWSIKYDDQYAALCAAGVDDWVVNMIGTSFNTGVQPGIGFNVGWNLFGNPYPSAINPDFITWPAGIMTNSLWMWDGKATGAFNWVLASNGLGVNIPPAQGFFLDQATAPGTFTFNGTTGVGGERMHDNFQNWYKGASDLLAVKATVEGLSNSDIAYIRFNDVSTAGLDKEWDANKKFAEIAETPQIYTTTGGLELALNTQPETDMVPMSFVCGTAGTYTIEAIETGTFTYVVLEDLVTGVQTNLLEDPYTFDYTNVEEVNNFIVHFAPLGVGELNANSVKIWSLENNIIVNVPANVTGEIAVYNMMGQEVARTDIEPVETQIPVSDVNTNYVVKVISDSNAVTGKVYVK